MPAKPAASAVPDSAVDAVLAASRVLVGIAGRALPESADVTLRQFRALVLLDGGRDLTVNELAEQLGVSASTVTRLCDRLVRKGLVTRRPGPENRREVWIATSDEGSALVAEVMERRRAAVTAVLGRLDPSDQAALAAALSKFVEAGDDDGGAPPREAWSGVMM